MARPFFIFITSLFILISLQILLEDYFNIFDIILGPLEEADESKVFQVKPKFINTNVVSDEQLMDYVFQKSNQVKLAHLYLRRLIPSLKNSNVPLPKAPLLPALFDHLYHLKYFQFSDSFDILSNLLEVSIGGGQVPGGVNIIDDSIERTIMSRLDQNLGSEGMQESQVGDPSMRRGIFGARMMAKDSKVMKKVRRWWIWASSWAGKFFWVNKMQRSSDDGDLKLVVKMASKDEGREFEIE